MTKKKRYYIKIIVLLLVFLVVIASGFYLRKNSKQAVDSRENLSTSLTADFYKNDFSLSSLDSNSGSDLVDLPKSFLIKNFPFQTQAPFANWDEIHDEACEEASIILVNYFLNQKDLSKEIMDKEILEMVEWEEKNFGGHFDLTVSQTLNLAQNFYGLKGQILNDANMIILRQEIAKGNPVIVPTAGRLLGNPNFRGEGPAYHMVVAIGFDEKNIIVQDVGTRNGERYVYNQKIFENAWHDWTGGYESIKQGRKNMLILSSQ